MAPLATDAGYSFQLTRRPPRPKQPAATSSDDALEF